MSDNGQKERTRNGKNPGPDSARDERLPLTDFEAYMLLDDRPSHPMVITMALQIDGDLNRSSFTSAVYDALSKHTLLRSVVVGRGRRLQWRSSNVRPKIEWQNGIESVAPPVPYIDLRKAIGVRVRVEWTVSRSVVYFCLHHACCDGISSLRFIGDVLANYATEAGGAESPGQRSEFQPELLALRSSVGSEGTRPSVKQCLKETATILMRAASSLRQSPVRLSGEPNRSIVTRSLPRAVARGVRLDASRLGVSVNDLCASELACVLAEWNTLDKQSGPFRLILPLSLRTPLHDAMSAANCISYLPMDFAAEDTRDVDSLARTFHQRVASALACNFGWLYLKSLNVGFRVPGFMSWFVSSRRRLCTAVFANVGDVRRSIPIRFPQSQGRLIAGNIRVDRIDGVAPIRPNTSLAVSIGTYAGELVVNMRADSAVLSHRDADSLLDTLVRRLQQRSHVANRSGAAA